MQYLFFICDSVLCLCVSEKLSCETFNKKSTINVIKNPTPHETNTKNISLMKMNNVILVLHVVVFYCYHYSCDVYF